MNEVLDGPGIGVGVVTRLLVEKLFIVATEFNMRELIAVIV